MRACTHIHTRTFAYRFAAWLYDATVFVMILFLLVSSHARILSPVSAIGSHVSFSLSCLVHTYPVIPIL